MRAPLLLVLLVPKLPHPPQQINSRMMMIIQLPLPLHILVCPLFIWYTASYAGAGKWVQGVLNLWLAA